MKFASLNQPRSALVYYPLQVAGIMYIALMFRRISRLKTIIRLINHFYKGFGRTISVLGVIVIIGVVYNAQHDINIPLSAYDPILEVIAKGESNSNYNAYFGHPDNNTIHFTDMTIGEVLNWQAEYIRQGNISSAVGKYQIVRDTLQHLVMLLDEDLNDKFDEQMQDRLAISLLEKRGSIKFASGELSHIDFANNISMEWAALPKMTGDNPEASYYSHDGVNKSTIEIDDVMHALSEFKRFSRYKVS